MRIYKTEGISTGTYDMEETLAPDSICTRKGNLERVATLFLSTSWPSNKMYSPELSLTSEIMTRIFALLFEFKR